LLTSIKPRQRLDLILFYELNTITKHPACCVPIKTAK
jgi:hypothetical protein